MGKFCLCEFDDCKSCFIVTRSYSESRPNFGLVPKRKPPPPDPLYLSYTHISATCDCMVRYGGCLYYKTPWRPFDLYPLVLILCCSWVHMMMIFLVFHLLLGSLCDILQKFSRSSSVTHCVAWFLSITHRYHLQYI